jgi:ABC-type antimicrobial peptide transport system permease subunit
MNEGKRMGLGTTLLVTLVAFILVLALFYGLNHFIMNIQGLPLNADLSPAG